MRRRSLALALALVAVVVLGGCGPSRSGDPSAASSPPAAADSPRRSPSEPSEPSHTSTAARPLSTLDRPDGGLTATFAYGPARAQQADLLLPAALAGADVSGNPVPVVVLVHGGYWHADADRTYERAVADDLVADGAVVWNVDYRGVGAADPADDGGWPRTFEDVAAAVDLLPGALASQGLALGPVAVVGHSAGGQLALWIASRPSLPDGAPGADPVVVPDTVVSQAGVNDLTRAARGPVSSGPVAALLGGTPGEVPERYDLVDPARRVPLGVPALAVTGADDDVVDASFSRDYVDAAVAAGGEATLVVVPGEGHGAHLDPGSTSWKATRAWLAERGFGR